MKVYLERQKKTVEVQAKTGRDVLAQLNLPSAEVLLVRDQEVLLLDDELRETDTLRVLSVISGG